MSKPNPVIERIKQHRADLDAKITSTRATLATLEAEATMLDRIMAPPVETPPSAPRTRRRVAVQEHTRTIAGTDPGAALPIIES